MAAWKEAAILPPPVSAQVPHTLEEVSQAAISQRFDQSLPLWRCCRLIGRGRVQNSPTIRAIRSREHAFELPNDTWTQPHFLDRTERIAGLAEQGLITRVIKGFILEMAIVQRLADPPRQRVDRFRLAGSGVTPHVSPRPHRELA